VPQVFFSLRIRFFQWFRLCPAQLTFSTTGRPSFTSGEQYAFMRISRGNEIIGEFSVVQIKRRIEDGRFFATDCYYDEDSSDWLALAGFLANQAAIKADKAITRPCYCGSALPFHACHGDGSQY
jgi:hypothetical protein